MNEWMNNFILVSYHLVALPSWDTFSPEKTINNNTSYIRTFFQICWSTGYNQGQSRNLWTTNQNSLAFGWQMVQIPALGHSHTVIRQTKPNKNSTCITTDTLPQVLCSLQIICQCKCLFFKQPVQTLWVLHIKQIDLSVYVIKQLFMDLPVERTVQDKSDTLLLLL